MHIQSSFVLSVHAHCKIMLSKKEENKIEIYKHVMRTLSEHTMSPYVLIFTMTHCLSNKNVFTTNKFTLRL